MSTVLFLKHGLLSGTKMSTTVADAKLVNEQRRHTLDFRKRGTYNWISVQKQASRISKLEFNHKTKKFENLKKRKGTPLPFGSKVKFERNREKIVRKQGSNCKDWDWEWDWGKRSEVTTKIEIESEIEENVARWSLRKVDFERTNKVNQVSFSNVGIVSLCPFFRTYEVIKRFLKKYIKRIWKKNMEGIFPGVYHKTSSIYQRFRKPSLCVTITGGFITSVNKSPLK